MLFYHVTTTGCTNGDATDRLSHQGILRATQYTAGFADRGGSSAHDDYEFTCLCLFICAGRF